jgi:hypothetical protein
MKLESDLKEFVELLSAHEVRFVIVGAFAVAFHGYPRYTADLDIYVDTTIENAERLVSALERFGFGQVGLTVADFTQADQVVQLGVSPNRIDLLTFLSGVSFEEVWRTRESGELDGSQVAFISRDLLRRNKAASARPQDLADLEHL